MENPSTEPFDYRWLHNIEASGISLTLPFRTFAYFYFLYTFSLSVFLVGSIPMDALGFQIPDHRSTFSYYDFFLGLICVAIQYIGVWGGRS